METERTDFIRELLREAKAAGRELRLRFPPEPNGYLHIGHAKAICLNFGAAQEFGATCNLRFDDTNPLKESTEFVESMQEDIRWLGYQWDGMYFVSDYFDQLYEWAVKLIRQGDAYVDSLSPEEIKAYRGTPMEPGRDSPYRTRPVDENLALFERMRAGEFKEGEAVLRAKIDMRAANYNMRDPVIYRILHARHHRTGDAWCIYPMYDYAHPMGDAIEGITHSLCTLEFENHRPLYDWFVEKVDPPAKPRQIEFARLNLAYTMMSKRKLKQLVEEKHVAGWDDPRMPTLRGMRRRGFPPRAIREFAAATGVTKFNAITQLGKLEYHVREVLNKEAQRRMAVLEPLKVTISNFPEGEVEWFAAANNPEDEAAGTRDVPFSRTLYIEREDFLEDPPKKFHRLAPGKEVRLRWAYLVTCTEVVKDAAGNVVELICTYDPATRGGDAPDGRKVKGTIHWVSAAHAVPVTVRLYDVLFAAEQPSDLSELNPQSLQTAEALAEPSVAELPVGDTIQFERKGYFCVDADSTPERPLFNRTATLKDSWTKQAGR